MIFSFLADIFNDIEAAEALPHLKSRSYKSNMYVLLSCMNIKRVFIMFSAIRV